MAIGLDIFLMAEFPLLSTVYIELSQSKVVVNILCSWIDILFSGDG
jgi:hypothetical protein